MKARTIVGLAVAALVVMAARADAQNDPSGRWVLTPRSSGVARRGVAVRPAQPQVIVIPGRPVVPRFPVFPVAYTLLPAIVLSDGTVLANFGLGYEPVLRFCGQQFVVNSSPTVIAGNGRVISGGTLPPVPNQPTQSELNLPSNQVRYPILTSASQMACYTRDSAGRYFVIR